jgi:dolichyl-phosphate beta-glucosyltransferase
VLRGLEMIDKGECEIAHGSRKMDGCRINRPQSRWRRVCSRLFRWVVHSWLRMPSHLTDTQCGFKVYRGDVAKKLYAEAITDGFSFDVEIIIRAHRYGYRIKEFPVEWTCDCDSRISLRRTSFRVMRELLRIKRVLGKEEVAAAAKTVQEA